MGRTSQLSSSSSNEEEGKEIDDGDRLDLPMKALQQDEETEKSKPFEGINEEKVAGLGGEDGGTEGSQAKDWNLNFEEGGLGSGENVDPGCGSASDQEKKFKGEEGLVAVGTSKECFKDKENMEEGEKCEEDPSGVKNKGDRSDEHKDFFRKVFDRLAQLQNDIRRTSLEDARLVGEIQEMNFDVKKWTRSPKERLNLKLEGIEHEKECDLYTPILEQKRITKCGKQAMQYNFRIQYEEVLRERERLELYWESRISDLENKMKELEEVKIKGKGLNSKVSEYLVKREKIKKKKSEIENSLDLLSKELEEEQLKLHRLKDNLKDLDVVIEVVIRTIEDVEVSSEDEAGREVKGLKLVVPPLPGSAGSKSAAGILHKNFKRG